MPRHTHYRRSSFLGAALFSLCSIAVFQQAVLTQGDDLAARLIPVVRTVSVSSSSSSSRGRRSVLRIMKSSASASLRKAAPALSPRRRSTGALVITRSSRAPAVAIKAGCGDGLITGDEQCDDKNKNAKDGCSATCTVETGYSCTSAQPSMCWSICGDGLVASNERCDDGNMLAGDGCSANCKDELGYKCSGTPSVCAIPAYCGNEVVETGEACDDGNSRQFDGCFACKIE